MNFEQWVLSVLGAFIIFATVASVVRKYLQVRKTRPKRYRCPICKTPCGIMEDVQDHIAYFHYPDEVEAFFARKLKEKKK